MEKTGSWNDDSDTDLDW